MRIASQFAMLVVAAAFAAGCGSSAAAPHRSPKPAVAVTSSPRRAPAQTGAQAKARRLRAWYLAGGHAALMRVVTSFGKISTALRAGGVPAAGRACAAMATAVLDAEQSPPVPDKAIERWYARALGDYALGASECADAVATTSVPVMDEASRHFSAGTRALGRSAKMIIAVVNQATLGITLPSP